MCCVSKNIYYSNKSNNVSDKVPGIVLFTYVLQQISLKLSVLSIKTR